MLQLRSIEREKFVDLNSTRVLSREIHESSSTLMFKLLLQVISSCLFVILDFIFYHVLAIVAQHSRIDFVQTGVHVLNITVKGSSYISDYVRRAIDGFNVNENITVIGSNEPCLPRPKKVETSSIYQISGLILIQLVLIFNQAYIHRLKLITCSFFHRQQEEARIKFLYKHLLRRRKKIFKAIEWRLKEKFKVDGNIEQRRNLFQVNSLSIS